MAIKKASLLLIASTLFLSACSEKVVDPLCDGRARAQQQSSSVTALLKMDIGEERTIKVNLELPADILSAEYQLLNTPEEIFSPAGSSSCQLSEKKIKRDSDRIVANYQYGCEAQAQLKEMDIYLLDKFSSVDEVEAFINKEAVGKHFVISRQCGRPIFNLASE